MNWFLYLIGFATWAYSAHVFYGSSTGIQQIFAAVLFTTAAVFIIGGAIVSAIKQPTEVKAEETKVDDFGKKLREFNAERKAK